MAIVDTPTVRTLARFMGPEMAYELLYVVRCDDSQEGKEVAAALQEWLSEALNQ